MKTTFPHAIQKERFQRHSYITQPVDVAFTVVLLAKHVSPTMHFNLHQHRTSTHAFFETQAWVNVDSN